MSVAKERRWTAEEEQKLRKLWAGPGGIKEAILPAFPQRSYKSITTRASSLGLGPRKHVQAASYSPLWEVISCALRKTPGLSANAIAALTGLSYHSVMHLLYRKYGRGEVHVSGHVRQANDGYAARCWSLGSGQDAPRPGPEAREQREARYRKELTADPLRLAVKNGRRRILAAERKGTLARRDPLVAALFGEAA